MNDQVRALAVSGCDLYAGGYFTNAGRTLPAVYALAVSGNDLYAGGLFSMAGGTVANQIAKWDGSSWSALSSGMEV